MGSFFSCYAGSGSFTRSGLKRFTMLTVPSLYPFMFATFRISFGVAWKVALTAELIGGGSGFGYLFDLARQDYRTPILFVVILLIIYMSWLLFR